MMQSLGFYGIEYSTIGISASLINNILKLSETLPSLHRSNKGGWQGLFQADELEWFVPTLNTIRVLLPDYYIHSCWFNINSPGHYNAWHRHTPRELVGVLYLQVPEDSGSILFRERGVPKRFQPVAGQLITFSGSLEHMVLENKSLENRISVAINFEK